MPKKPCPVGDEFFRHLHQGPGGLYNFSRLWEAAGRPKGKSPRQWDARRMRWSVRSAIVSLVGKDSGPPMAEELLAFEYAGYLDPRVTRPHPRRRVPDDADPGARIRELVGECERLLEATAAEHGVSQREAVEILFGSLRLKEAPGQGS